LPALETSATACSANVVTGFEFPRTQTQQKPRPVIAETSLPVTIFASLEMPGSANVVTGFEFPRTQTQQKPRPVIAETSLPVTIFASLETSATGC
jgi:hypothetical protein